MVLAGAPADPLVEAAAKRKGPVLIAVFQFQNGRLGSVVAP